MPNTVIDERRPKCPQLTVPRTSCRRYSEFSQEDTNFSMSNVLLTTPHTLTHDANSHKRSTKREKKTNFLAQRRALYSGWNLPWPCWPSRPCRGISGEHRQTNGAASPLDGTKDVKFKVHPGGQTCTCDKTFHSLYFLALFFFWELMKTSAQRCRERQNWNFKRTCQAKKKLTGSNQNKWTRIRLHANGTRVSKTVGLR